MSKIENATAGPHFSDNWLTMTDVMYAPIFRYIKFLSEQLDVNIYESSSKVKSWGVSVLKSTSIIESVPESYEEELVDFIGKRNEFLLNKIT